MNNKLLKKNNLRAFSLIELSIVILIIGILVAGVTQSSRLIRQMQLSSARSLTTSSPVSSISGLVAWYEPTLEKSFDEAEENDNTGVSRWYDINPTSTNKNDLIQTDANRRPLFISNAVNGLPSLRFNGVNTYLQSSGFIPEHNSVNFSIFIVHLNLDVSNIRAIFCNRFGPAPYNDLRGFVIYSSSGTYSGTYGTGSGGWSGPAGFSTSNGVKDIIAVIGSNTNVSLYRNGSAPIVSNMNYAPNRSRSTSVGSMTACELNDVYFYNGFISEIILYNRNISNDERIDVEKYLAKKWAIKI
jgi:prepilin-type N-terminal cleavage/methylation domain-containing protein